jgi:hypothetical protein
MDGSNALSHDLRKVAAERSHGESELSPRVRLTRGDAPMTRVSTLWLCALCVVVLLCQTQLALADDSTGKIKSVNVDKKEFVMTDKNGKDWTFRCTKDCKLTCEDKECTISDLKTGLAATVTYEKKDDILWASKVEAKK